MGSMPAPGRFELHMGLRIEMISMVRKFIEALYTQLIDDDVAYRVGLTAHELMDNAVRCSAFGLVTVRVEMTADALVVHTTNHADPRDIEVVERAIEEMRSQDDALSYYLSLMHRTARTKHSSGLGLGRIWAEADMTLSCETSADQVSIRARMPLARCGV